MNSNDVYELEASKIDNKLNPTHINYLINAMLVNAGARTACLVQPIDYGEIKSTDKNTSYVLKLINEYFPQLYFIDEYLSYQGIIITLNKNLLVDLEIDIITLDKMGEILGYPCYKGFSDIDRCKTTYAHNINMSVIISNNESNVQCDEYNLIANMSDKITDKITHQFEKMATDFEKILNESENIKILEKILSFFHDNKGKITKIEVSYEMSDCISTLSLIDVLSNDIEYVLTENEQEAFINVLYNLSFNETILDNIDETIEYDNPIHKGIILSLLLNEQYDILEPFCPLTQYPTKSEECGSISENMAMHVVNVLHKTKLKTNDNKNTNKNKY